MVSTIRLMTANLLVDRADRAHLRDVMEMLDPDVLVVQELGHKTAELMDSRFPHHELRPELDSKGRGIASKFPGKFGDIPMPWRAGLWARLQLGSGSILVGNIHARNPIVFPWWRSVQLRTGQLEALFRWADEEVGEGPFVLAGDMNASPAWPFYRRLAERWDDIVARSAAESEGDPAPTWAWRPGWPRLLRIDHVFGTGARAVTTEVVPIRGSDHAAVVVDLALD